MNLYIQSIYLSMIDSTLILRFKQKEVAYAVVGGLAVSLHGAIRGTVDLDLVVNMELDNLLKVEEILTGLGMTARLPVSAHEIYNFRNEYIEKRNLVAWTFVDLKNPLKIIDIIITHDLRDMSSQIFKTKMGDISVICKEDLIAMKEYSGRPQDLEDIRALKKL